MAKKEAVAVETEVEPEVAADEPVIEPEPVIEKMTVAAVMPVERFGSVGLGSRTTVHGEL